MIPRLAAVESIDNNRCELARETPKVIQTILQ